MSILITVLASVFIFGLIIFIHEFGHFITAKTGGIRVNEFSLGMGPKLLSFEKGETAYSLRLLPIGGFVAMEGENGESDDARSFGKAPVGRRIATVAAGAMMNLVLGFAVLLILTCDTDLVATRTVAKFHDGAVTAQSGLQVGDEIVAINGRRILIANDVGYEMARVQEDTADITVIRDGARVELRDVRFETMTLEDGSSAIIYDFYFLGEEKTVGNVLRESALWTVSVARQVFMSFIDLITGRVAVKQLSGPVGIVTVIGEAASMGWYSLAILLAFISINLGVFNLLPVPALDGGRLLLLIVEAVTRRRLPEKYEAAINVAGFALLMTLMLYATFNDVGRLFTR